MTTKVITYDMVTNREDLSDVLTLVAQEETPFVSNVGTNDADATLHEWPEVELNAPNDGGILEGAPAPSGSPDADQAIPTRHRNVTMIRSRVAATSNTQQAVDSAGITNMLDKQVALRLREIKRDIEKCAVGSLRPMVLGSGAVPRVARTVGHFLTTNVVLARGAGDVPIVGSWVPGANDTTAGTAGTAGGLSQSAVVEGMRKCFLAGAMPSLLLCSPANLEAVGQFTGRVQTTLDVNQTATNLFFVEVIKTPYGVLKAVPNPQMPDTFVLGLTPDMAKVTWLRRMSSFALAITGDSRSRQIVGEFTFSVLSEKSHFLIATLNGTYEPPAP